MANIEGLYTALNVIIRTKEDENRLAIDVQTLINEVKNEVDIYSAPFEWYVQAALRAAAEVALWRNGYRSVVKGNGLFVNVSHCDNPEYMKRLYNNEILTEKQKQKIKTFLLERVKQTNIPGQLIMDFDSGTIIEDVSTQQLIEMLTRDANGSD